jgi:hypothetical protein
MNELMPHMLTISNKILSQTDIRLNTISDPKSEETDVPIPLNVIEPDPEPEPEPELEPELEPEPEPDNSNKLSDSSKYKTHETISPKQSDTLFWCVYIAIFGYNDYLKVTRNYGMKELEIKKQIADFLQKTPSAFKNTNIKVTKVAIQEILSELLTSQKETSIMCLLAILVKYHINIILLDPTDRFYLEYYCDISMKENPTFLIQKDTFGKYKLYSESFTVESLEQWKKSRFMLTSYLKPLHSLTTYKVSELEEIAKKYNVHNEPKKSKKGDLYNDICDVLRWR